MTRLRLIHWDKQAALERAAALSALGYEVDGTPFDPAALARLRGDPPAAILIDLSRLPAQGRDLGIAVRKYKSTRLVPLLFIEGKPEKVAPIKALLPDAVFTTWEAIETDLGQALAAPPRDPVVPSSVFAAYQNTPLVKKLGLKPDQVVAVLNGPDGFVDQLGTLPQGVSFRFQARGKCDLVIWFVTSARELKRRIARIGQYAGRDGLWIAWPKKSSSKPTDLTQALVRKEGLAQPLVDYKVCAIDKTWTGLKFAHRPKR